MKIPKIIELPPRKGHVEFSLPAGSSCELPGAGASTLPIVDPWWKITDVSPELGVSKDWLNFLFFGGGFIGEEGDIS